MLGSIFFLMDGDGYYGSLIDEWMDMYFLI